MAPIYIYDGKILVEGANIATDAACCCADNCYLLRRCDTDGFCTDCDVGGEDANMPMLLDIVHSGTTYYMLANFQYDCRYWDVAAFDKGINEVDLYWDGLNWQLSINFTPIGTGGTDPCDPTGTFGAATVSIGDEARCEYFPDSDIVTNTDLSAEFAGGKIIKITSTGFCYKIICEIACSAQSAGGPYDWYTAGPLPAHTIWDSCNMCIDNCASCNPALPSTITAEFNDTIWLEFPDPAFAGSFNLEYQGINDSGWCVWSAFIYNGGAPAEDHYWCLVNDGVNWKIIVDDTPQGDNHAADSVFREWFWRSYEGGDQCLGACTPFNNSWQGAAWVEIITEPYCPTTNNCGGCAPELLNRYTVTVTGTNVPECFGWNGDGTFDLIEGFPWPFVGDGTPCTWRATGYMVGPFGGSGNWSMSYSTFNSRWELHSEGQLGFTKAGTYCDGPVGVWSNVNQDICSPVAGTCVVS